MGVWLYHLKTNDRLPAIFFENHFYHHGCWPVPVFEVAPRTPTDFQNGDLNTNIYCKHMIVLKNIYLFSGLSVIELFEEFHFHGVADLIVLVREEVQEGGEDAFAKENDQQVEGKNEGGKSREVKEEQGEKSDFQIHV